MRTGRLLFEILDEKGKIISYWDLQYKHARKVFKTNAGPGGFSAPYNEEIVDGDAEEWTEIFNKCKNYGPRDGGNCWDALRRDITRTSNDGDSIESVGEVEFYDGIYYTMIIWLKGYWDLIDHFEKLNYTIRNRTKF